MVENTTYSSGSLMSVAGPSLIAALAADGSLGGNPITASAGATIYGLETAAEFVFLIHTGQVRIYEAGPDGEERLLEILGPGDWFGAAALARAATYKTRAAAVHSSELTQVPVDAVLEIAGRRPELAAELIRQIAGKLQAARDDASRLVFDDCNNRLIKTLLKFSRSAAATVHADGVVLHITHQQLAQAVGVARETVSLALTQLRNQNLLRTGRNQLSFDPEALRVFQERATPQEVAQVS